MENSPAEVLSKAAMVDVLKQFRDRFPAATITSDLLMVHGDQFIVKVTVQTQEAGTVSGMAADIAVEVAEDRARQRALQSLCIWEKQAEPPVDSEFPSTLLSPSKAIAQNPSELRPPLISPEVLASKEKDLMTANSPWHDSVKQAANVIPPHVVNASEESQETEKSTSPIAKSSTISKLSTKPAIAETFSEEPIDSSANSVDMASPETLPPPVNLSDVIAQTDVELRRLGWSVADGREYLESTYGKRSRHDLTDEELLAFLLHLESLPTS